jgi:hypothetical protein
MPQSPVPGAGATGICLMPATKTGGIAREIATSRREVRPYPNTRRLHATGSRGFLPGRVGHDIDGHRNS